MKIVNLQISFYVTAHTYLHMYKHTHGNTQTHTHTGRGINFGTVELECLSQPRRGNFQHASIEFPSCADETMSPLCIISADISSSTLYSTHHINGWHTNFHFYCISNLLSALSIAAIASSESCCDQHQFH